MVDGVAPSPRVLRVLFGLFTYTVRFEHVVKGQNRLRSGSLHQTPRKPNDLSTAGFAYWLASELLVKKDEMVCGVVIVPPLVFGFGVDIRYAMGPSLISVIAHFWRRRSLC
jgi:hypothetical protein